MFDGYFNSVDVVVIYLCFGFCVVGVTCLVVCGVWVLVCCFDFVCVYLRLTFVIGYDLLLWWIYRCVVC